MLHPLTAFCALVLVSCLATASCFGRTPEQPNAHARSDTTAAKHTERHKGRHSPPTVKPGNSLNRGESLPLPPLPPPPHKAREEKPATHPVAKPGIATKGSVTGLPLPRFVSLRADPVNMRVGPGLRYRITWVYKRRHLPVEIRREFGDWRFVQDSEGVEGWMHRATLMPRRSFVILAPRRVLHRMPDPHAPPVALLDPGVIGWLERCDAGAAWCRVQVDGYRGWLQRHAFWGTLPNEAVHD